MAERYQSSAKKSTKKFEVMGSKEVAVRLPLPLVEVWEELQPEVEHLTGLAGLKIIRAVIEDEVMRRVGPRHQPDAASSCLRWGQQSGYVVFAGQKVAVQHPRVRTRHGEEVHLDSYARLQHDGRRQRAVREGIVAGLSSRNYHRAVDSVLSGYGIEKSSVSRQFVQASAAELKKLYEKKLDKLDLVAILIDGIHLGKQVLVVALGIESSETLLVRDRRGQGSARRDRTRVRRARRSAALPDSQATERERAFAPERPGRYGPKNPQRVRDDQLRGGQSGTRENLSATGAHQSQCGAQPGRRTGGNPHRASVGRGNLAAANVGFQQSHRVVPFHRRARGTERETLASRGPRVALDGHRITGSGKEISEGEGLSGTGTLAAQTESVVDSTGAGGVTCRKSRAATFN